MRRGAGEYRQMVRSVEASPATGISTGRISALRRLIGAHCLRLADSKSRSVPAARRCWGIADLDPGAGRAVDPLRHDLVGGSGVDKFEHIRIQFRGL
jgi:hypothetical protein